MPRAVAATSPLPSRRRRIFEQADRDHDGVITAAELRASRIDEDGDGRVDHVELLHAVRRAGYDVHEEEVTFVEAILAAAGDADHDGVLTLAEINARAAAEVSKS